MHIWFHTHPMCASSACTCTLVCTPAGHGLPGPAYSHFACFLPVHPAHNTLLFVWGARLQATVHLYRGITCPRNPCMFIQCTHTHCLVPGVDQRLDPLQPLLSSLTTPLVPLCVAACRQRCTCTRSSLGRSTWCAANTAGQHHPSHLMRLG